MSIKLSEISSFKSTLYKCIFIYFINNACFSKLFTKSCILLYASVIEGTYYDAAGTAVIAAIPSREVLISRLLGSLQSPITCCCGYTKFFLASFY